MKVIWGKFGTGVDLILCVIINYYVVSIWVNGKDEFHAYSLKTSIIFLIEVMLVLMSPPAAITIWNCADSFAQTTLML